ncbi:hypothetical protein [Spirillospora sp. NPDC047279]|uniref:hypothetical protein n=1 Tax=Spirillospora sp. NPDC047279 TaxID=3155478 RepID=UPI0033F0D7EA
MILRNDGFALTVQQGMARTEGDSGSSLPEEQGNVNQCPGSPSEWKKQFVTGVIIAAIGAGAGVTAAWLTNNGQERALARQMIEDRDRSQKDRIAEIYMGFLQATNKARATELGIQREMEGEDTKEKPLVHSTKMHIQKLDIHLEALERRQLMIMAFGSKKAIDGSQQVIDSVRRFRDSLSPGEAINPLRVNHRQQREIDTLKNHGVSFSGLVRQELGESTENTAACMARS